MMTTSKLFGLFVCHSTILTYHACRAFEYTMNSSKLDITSSSEQQLFICLGNDG